MISRSYAWLDESVEHSEADEARAAALAKKWSELMTAEENRRFTQQFEREEGSRCEIEPEPCEQCGGDGFLGLDGPRNRRGKLRDLQEWQIGVKCPNSNCEDGDDVGPIKEFRRAEQEREAERSLEIELVEDKLKMIGARIMRPYEHWNEDERLMDYMENRGDY